MAIQIVGCYFIDFPDIYVDHATSNINEENGYYFKNASESLTLPPIKITLVEQKDYPIESTQITFDISNDVNVIYTDTSDIISNLPESPSTDIQLSGRVTYTLTQLDKLNYELLMTVIPNSGLLIGNETGYHMKAGDVSGVDVDDFPDMNVLLEDLNIGDFESRKFTDMLYIKLYYVLVNDDKKRLNPSNTLDFSHTYTFIAAKSSGGGQ